MSDDDSTGEYQPVTAFDVSDENPSAVANQLRALQREVRDGFDSIGRALTALSRIEERLIVVIERQNFVERRIDVIEKRVTSVEREHAEIRGLVEKINTNATRRRTAAKGKK
jgi:hypothetical protein